MNSIKEINKNLIRCTIRRGSRKRKKKRIWKI